VLPAVGSRRAAAKLLQKIRAANAAPVRYGRCEIAVTVSIGAAVYPLDGRRDVLLRKKADAALYAAKAAGGNCWRFV